MTLAALKRIPSPPRDCLCINDPLSPCYLVHRCTPWTPKLQNLEQQELNPFTSGQAIVTDGTREIRSMGLSSIWTALVGSRVKEITPHRPFSFEQQEAHATELATPRGHHASPYGNHAAAFSEAAISQPTITREEKQAKRRRRGFSLSATKSDGDLRKRKSWFGAKPAADDAPAVPALPPLRPADSSLRWNETHATPAPKLSRPGTAVTVDDQVPWRRPATPEAAHAEQRKSRRLSLGKALLSSRKRSKSTVSQAPPTPVMAKRQSVLGGHRDMAPPVPALPASATELIDPSTGVVPSLEASFDKRRSRRMSFSRTFSRESRKSTASMKSQRGTWWQSSNPDGDEAPPPVPSVPSLTGDDGTATPDSTIGLAASPDHSNFVPGRSDFGEMPVRTVTRGTSIKQPRPVSGVSLSSRKSYKPTNAANGFLKSTTSRSSRRHSLLDDGDGGMICLSDEQQKEWDKLKHLMVTLEARQASPPASVSTDVASLDEESGVLGMLREYEDEENKRHRRMYSNADALAQLEFGTAR
ncbi:hypothetical protein LTR53_009760 [Teratosphaeriaceae sp. CCFEE 6253]|nr:hypothetical protein LTR53_009760 [Teratosphaeriaceae sp. CCFEE 6253]